MEEAVHASALPMAHIYAPAPYVTERVPATKTLSVLWTLISPQGRIPGTSGLLLFMYTDFEWPRQLCVFGSALFAWQYV